MCKGDKGKPYPGGGGRVFYGGVCLRAHARVLCGENREE